MKITIACADPIGGKTVESVEIHISEKLPAFNDMTQADTFYEEEAQCLGSALTNSLPQATRLRLIRYLLSMEIAAKGYFRGL